MNVKLTLIKLHEAFPEMDLDELLKVLECVVMNPISYWEPYMIPGERNITTTCEGITLY